MPLYEYECQHCKRHTEKIQKFSDPEITLCPHCGGALERVISAPAIAFKGGGWYKDGYGNSALKAAGTETTGSSPEKPSGADNSPGKTESTAASAPAAPAAAPPAAPSPTK